MEIEDEDNGGGYGSPYQLDDCWRPGDEALPGARPRGWMTAAQVVAWIVWRETVGRFEWQQAFYPGAEDWLHPHIPHSEPARVAKGDLTFASPAEMPAWMREAFNHLGISSGRFVAGSETRGHRRMVDAPEIWPAAAKAVLDWMNGEQQPGPQLPESYLRACADDGRKPEQHMLEIANMLGDGAGYSRHLRNYQFFWKGSEALRRSLATDKLPAYGRAPAAAHPGRLRIPAQVFASPVAICASAILPCTAEEAWDEKGRPLPIWTDMLLDAEAVVAVWPEYVAPDEANGTAATESAASSSADAWMAANARGRKYDDAISTCMKETGATNRAARAAWGRLPVDVRGKRGPQRRG